MGSIETMAVRDASGNTTVINVSDFDAKLHKKVVESGSVTKKSEPAKVRKARSARQ
jgi:hypothetical protein|tara:strand:- start:5218 stop:5385 length:168 start_codon:yes stop_codon:yes gene_type:complete